MPVKSGRRIDEITVITTAPFTVSGNGSARKMAKKFLKKQLDYDTMLLKDLDVVVAAESAR